MPAVPTKYLIASVEGQLHQYQGLEHLRVTARGEVLSIVSGPETDPIRHARLCRQAVDLWRLDVAGRGGRYEPTPLQDTAENLIALLVEQLGWVLTPQDDSHWEPGAN